MNPGNFETSLMTSEHALEDWHCTLLRLRVRAAETDQPSRTVFSGRQRAKVSTHVPEVAARCERSPLLRGWVLEATAAELLFFPASRRPRSSPRWYMSALIYVLLKIMLCRSLWLVYPQRIPDLDTT